MISHESTQADIQVGRIGLYSVGAGGLEPTHRSPILLIPVTNVPTYVRRVSESA
jgi:hypothetical protein